MLAPGQSWDTYWDFLPRRDAATYPDKHTARIVYRDQAHRQTVTMAELNWETHRTRMRMT